MVDGIVVAIRMAVIIVVASRCHFCHPIRRLKQMVIVHDNKAFMAFMVFEARMVVAVEDLAIILSNPSSFVITELVVFASFINSFIAKRMCIFVRFAMLNSKSFNTVTIHLMFELDHSLFLG